MVVLKYQRLHHSSIGYGHARLSSFGTSNFFKKNLCTRTGIFLFVIFIALVPTCGSCCFIRVTSPSLYWVLVLVFHRSIEGKLLNEILICGKCQRMSNMMVFWYLLVSEIVLSAGNLIALEELSMHW